MQQNRESQTTRKLLSGRVFSGFGKGAYFLSFYQDLLERCLGEKPFLGTLNVKVDPQEKQQFLVGLKQKMIQSFTLNGKTFGKVICYHAFDAEGNPLLLLFPEKSLYGDDVLEIVSALDLRKHFHLHDDDVFVVYAEGFRTYEKKERREQHFHEKK